MKRFRTILLFLIFGYGLSVVFLSTRQNLTNGQSHGSMIRVDLPVGSTVKAAAKTKALQDHLVPKRLEFVHITKTGGTAVERAGAKAGITWGMCHFWDNSELGCPSTPPGRAKQTPSLLLRNKLLLRENLPIPGFRGQSWHTPPAWIQPNSSTICPYRGRDTFTIVRNPYDRVVSEFYCPHFGYYGEFFKFFMRVGAAGITAKKPNQTSTATAEAAAQKKAMLSIIPPPTVTTFNDWIQRALRHVNPSTGHFVPQFYYVYDHVDGTKVVDHVLTYENLHVDFANLMKQYRLSVHLTPGKPQQRDAALRRRFTVADLEPRSICLINRRYANDFKLFGYRMIPKSCSTDDVALEPNAAHNNVL